MVHVHVGQHHIGHVVAFHLGTVPARVIDDAPRAIDLLQRRVLAGDRSVEDRDIDDARVLTEAAIFGDKTAVHEETVRLRSHIAQYRDILKLDEPVGRKLDFLTQELNRETNTIGSKCSELAITRLDRLPPGVPVRVLRRENGVALVRREVR